MRDVMKQAWGRPRAWAAGLGLLAVWCGLAGWWLWLPVATALDVGLVVVLGLAALALPGWLAWRVRRIWREARVWALLPVVVAVSLGVPWLLLRWVPGFEGLVAQALSAGVRLILAAVCFVGAWLYLVNCGEKSAEESVNGNSASVE